MTDDEKPTPSVPPSNQAVHPDINHGTRVLECKAVDTCDCGGTLYDEEIATGKVVVATWDPEHFDPDEYQLTTDWEQTERRVRCDRCSAGWYY